jgi:2-hydroxychromene-2-carboxylate isomerase
VLWLARQQGTPLHLPAMHPFNPLGLLRLATACDADGEPGRYVCEKIFRHVWCTGQDAADNERLAALTAELAPAQDPGSAVVKQVLQTHSQEAIELGVFGVPTWVVDGRVFWGQDALPMLRAYLQGEPWFEGPDWQAPARCEVGIRRS